MWKYSSEVQIPLKCTRAAYILKYMHLLSFHIIAKWLFFKTIIKDQCTVLFSSMKEKERKLENPRIHCYLHTYSLTSVNNYIHSKRLNTISFTLVYLLLSSDIMSVWLVCVTQKFTLAVSDTHVYLLNQLNPFRSSLFKPCSIQAAHS